MPAELSALLSELAKVVPNAVVIIIVLIIYNSKSNHDIKVIEKAFDNSRADLKTAYNDASEQLRKNMELLHK
jgi:hypothetical protein